MIIYVLELGNFGEGTKIDILGVFSEEVKAIGSAIKTLIARNDHCPARKWSWDDGNQEWSNDYSWIEIVKYNIDESIT